MIKTEARLRALDEWVLESGMPFSAQIWSRGFDDGCDAANKSMAERVGELWALAQVGLGEGIQDALQRLETAILEERE